MIRISEIVSVVIKYTTISVIVTSVLIGSVFYSSLYLGGSSNVSATQVRGNTPSTAQALTITMTSSQSTLGLNTSKSVVSSSTTSSYSLSRNSYSSSSSFTSASSCSNLDQTIEKNGTTYGMNQSGNGPERGVVFASFNFTKDSAAKQFTLTGSFISDKNFSLNVFYGNNTWDGNRTIVWSSFDNATGNYLLDLNLTLALYSQFAVWYDIEVQAYFGGPQPWLVNSTSNLQITTSQCASLSYLEYQH